MVNKASSWFFGANGFFYLLNQNMALVANFKHQRYKGVYQKVREAINHTL